MSGEQEFELDPELIYREIGQLKVLSLVMQKALNSERQRNAELANKLVELMDQK